MKRKITPEHKASVDRKAALIGKGPFWDCFGYDDFGKPADPGLANDRANALAPQLIGKTYQEAEREARNQGSIIRVVEENGQGFLMTQDVQPHRLNVCLTDGKITRVWVG